MEIKTFRFRFPGSDEVFSARASTAEEAAQHLLYLASGRRATVRRSRRHPNLLTSTARRMAPRSLVEVA